MQASQTVLQCGELFVHLAHIWPLPSISTYYACVTVQALQRCSHGSTTHRVVFATLFQELPAVDCHAHFQRPHNFRTTFEPMRLARCAIDFLLPPAPKEPSELPHTLGPLCQAVAEWCHTKGEVEPYRRMCAK